jgi:hypothetical protein
MISEQTWKGLITRDAEAQSNDTKPGSVRQRVGAATPHDMYIALKMPEEQRCLWYDFPEEAMSEPMRLPSLQSIDINLAKHPEQPGVLRFELALNRVELTNVFVALIDDIVSAVGETPDDVAGIQALTNRLERWRNLLKADATEGLSTLDRRGLFGELYVLGELLAAGVNTTAAATSWRGPYGAHQDFQGNSAAIEVKTSVLKQPQSLVIASERELDTTGIDELFLAHISLDERRGGNGMSLNERVDATRSHLAESAVASDIFDQALLRSGYTAVQHSLYDEPRYAIRQCRVFRVADGFPRITEHDVPTGVGAVNYRIQVAALAPFELDDNKPWERFKEKM